MVEFVPVAAIAATLAACSGSHVDRVAVESPNSRAQITASVRNGGGPGSY